MVKRSIFVVLVTGAMIGMMVWYSGRSAEMQPLRCIRPLVIDAADTLRVQGTVTEKSRVRVVCTRPARTNQVLVKPGDSVVRGQLLAILDPAGESDRFNALHQILTGLNVSALTSGGFTLSTDYQGAETGRIYLTAPVSGLVMECSLTVGTAIPAYSGCVVISDRSEMRIQARVGEETVKYLSEGMNCTVNVDALELSGMRGTLAHVAPYAIQTSTLTGAGQIETELSILMADTTGLLPGYTATAFFVVEEYKNALLVPYDCIGQDTDGEYVMTVQDGTVRKTPVVTGREFPQGVCIQAGLCSTTVILKDASPNLDGKAVNFT